MVAKSYLQTTISFASYGGVIVFSPFMTIVKHFKYQVIFFVALNVLFTGLLSTIDKTKETQGLVFSFFAALPVGWFEVVSGLLVQLIVDDIDLGIACCEYPLFL